MTRLSLTISLLAVLAIPFNAQASILENIDAFEAAGQEALKGVSTWIVNHPVTYVKGVSTWISNHPVTYFTGIIGSCIVLAQYNNYERAKRYAKWDKQQREQAAMHAAISEGARYAAQQAIAEHEQNLAQGSADQFCC